MISITTIYIADIKTSIPLFKKKHSKKTGVQGQNVVIFCFPHKSQFLTCRYFLKRKKAVN